MAPTKCFLEIELIDFVDVTVFAVSRLLIFTWFQDDTL